MPREISISKEARVASSQTQGSFELALTCNDMFL